MTLQQQSPNNVAKPPVTASDPAANEFLTFRLGGEEYGIDILKVQEIRCYDAITQIANSPGYQGCDQFARHHRTHRRYANQVQFGSCQL